MAHFAELDDQNYVLRVIVISNDDLLDDEGNEIEQKGRDLCASMLGGRWVQTSYNGNFRRRYAGIGFMYLEDSDEFVPAPPYASWIWKNQLWVAPKAEPKTGGPYRWNEEKQTWETIPVEPTEE